MFTFRSARSQATGPAPATDQAGRDHLAVDARRCDHSAATVSDPSRLISSHRTSQGHVVYYRCDCGITHLALMRWSREPSSGTARLR